MTLKTIPNGIQLSNNTLFKSLNFLKRELAKLVHRAHRYLMPTSLQCMFIPIDTVHRYPTSSSRSRRFCTPLIKSQKYSKWVSNAEILLWEKINPLLKSLTYNQFGKAFKAQLLKEY